MVLATGTFQDTGIDRQVAIASILHYLLKNEILDRVAAAICAEEEGITQRETEPGWNH